MMATDLKQQLARVTEAPDRKDMRGLIARMEPQLERALPKQVGVERFTRTVLTELERTPKLYECEPKSLLGAMMLAAQLGLEPGPLGQVYFVPFKNRATFIIGYRGMIALAFRSGLLRDIEARAVRQGDHFVYQYGTRPLLDFRPSVDRGSVEAYYGLARFKTKGQHFEVMTPAEIEERRKRSAAARSGSSPWDTDYEAMALKTVVRKMAPYLPLSPATERAFAVDEGTVPSDALDSEDIAETVEVDDEG